MAKILDDVASAVSLGIVAAQIASSIMKLKGYIDAVKDAPEGIRTLVDQIEVIQLLLSDIEESQPYDVGTAAISSIRSSQCLNLCRSGLKRLCSVADDLKAHN
ncbi:hypothetical protein B0J14DRAFT_483677 [Halenospora varia]|nr:hypothetical protein B0J14DRAFT_483677 [Halenospora varia]